MEQITFNRAQFKKFGMWALGVFLSVMALQTMFLDRNRPDLSKLQLRQDSLFVEAMKKQVAFAELLQNNNKILTDSVLSYMRKPVLTTLDSVLNIIATLPEGQTKIIQNQNRQTVMIKLELQEIRTENAVEILPEIVKDSVIVLPKTLKTNGKGF